MTRFRKKPVDVEMIQWTPGADVLSWADSCRLDGGLIDCGPVAGTAQLSFWCAASSAHVVIEEGDWICLERDGSGFYPLRAADQADAYEPIKTFDGLKTLIENADDDREWTALPPNIVLTEPMDDTLAAEALFALALKRADALTPSEGVRLVSWVVSRVRPF